jgi:hypothetical protein
MKSPQVRIHCLLIEPCDTILLFVMPLLQPVTCCSLCVSQGYIVAPGKIQPC